MTEWISVDDRLPNECEVLVFGSPTCGTHDDDPAVMEARYNIKENYFEFGEYDCGIDVTHWMPLPEPPEVKND